MGCKGDNDGEMYQALFTGSPDKWCSVILPFRKFLFTSRGMLIEEQQEMDSKRISTIGLLQAERAEGDFCIQLESINAISLETLRKETRYDPMDDGLFTDETFDDEILDGEDFDYASPKKKNYSKVIRY